MLVKGNRCTCAYVCVFIQLHITTVQVNRTLSYYFSYTTYMDLPHLWGIMCLLYFVVVFVHKRNTWSAGLEAKVNGRKAD